MRKCGVVVRSGPGQALELAVAALEPVVQDLDLAMLERASVSQHPTLPHAPLPPTMMLRELHGTLQVAMGWESLHLYQFILRGVRYGSRELAAASPDVTLNELRLRRRARFVYEYGSGPTKVPNPPQEFGDAADL